LWKMQRWVKWIVQRMHTSSTTKAPDKICHNNQTQTDADAYIDTYRYRYEQWPHYVRCRNHETYFQSYSERPRSVSLIPVHHHHEYDNSDWYLTKPIGTIVSSYTREINVSSTTLLAVGTSTEGVKAETTFILTLANG
jgi:hypothetical protein